MNNRFYTVCGVTEINGKVLLVRHTYGTAKGRILLPGGYVMENELPTAAAAREIFEETGVKTTVKSLMAMQFQSAQWCAVFRMDHISGTPRSDGRENSEVLLLTAKEAVKRPDITNMSRMILTAYMNKYSELRKSEYIPASANMENYIIFGV